MKRKIIGLISLVSLFIFTACDFPEEDDLYRTPELFLKQVELQFYKFRDRRITRDWVCILPEDEFVEYTDHDGRIKDQLKRITSYERVNKIIDKSGKFFTYERDCIECTIQFMRVYESGYIQISSPHWLSAGNTFFYKFDSALASSIYNEVINAIDYYQSSEKEIYRLGLESVEVENFFPTVENKATGGTVFYDKESQKDPKQIRMNNDLCEMLKNTTYKSRESNQDTYSSCFKCYFNDDEYKDSLSLGDDYVYLLSFNYYEVAIIRRFHDDLGRSYVCTKYYSIPKEDGENIYNYACALPKEESHYTE